MPKKFKKKSKRISCRKRYKIERKVKEHNKKVRKEAKKTQGKRKKKDPGVPNSCPFKEEVLKEAEDRKRRLEEERERQKEKRKRERERLLAKKRSLDSLVKDALQRGQQFDKKSAENRQEKSKEFTGGKSVESSLKQYYKEFRKVVEAADVILQVLDARDPLGSRCPQVEEAVLEAGAKKRLVLVLNKIDLVPRKNVEEWLKYLRNEFPAVAFKASTQTQRENLGQSKVPLSLASEDLVKSSRCLGADVLMKLLGNYCRNLDIKTTIRVGIVGFPNTGKSSIINSLKRSKACNVGATPGITRSMQEVQLDKHVKLLDSPGIVMATGTTDAAVILRNCVKVESVEDPVQPVAAILRRCSKHQMMLHYNVAHYSDVNEFLTLLAKRFGKLKKGGIPDTNKVARMVLQDWNTGKITYYTHPPEEQTAQVSSEIVTEMSKAFDIESLLKEEEEALQGLREVSTSDIIIEASSPMSGVLDEPDEEAGMDESEDEDKEGVEDMEDEEAGEPELKNVTVHVAEEKFRTSSKTGGVKVVREKEKKAGQERTVLGNSQLNKARKKEFKNMKKKRKRSDALAGQLADAFSGALGGLTKDNKDNDDDYNFATDFV